MKILLWLLLLIYIDDRRPVKPNSKLLNTSMANWLKKSRQEKRDWDKRQDCERCYRELLRDKIARKIEGALKAIEEKTRYKLALRSSLSSLEVLVSHPDWNRAELLDLHFKLTARSNGIFLMYGAYFARCDSSAPVLQALYSPPQPINKRIKIATIIKWVGRAAKTSRQSLSLTEHDAEDEMKCSDGTTAKTYRWRVSYCCLFRRLLRSSRLQ